MYSAGTDVSLGYRDEWILESDENILVLWTDQQTES
jgi:hypothetical protein